MVVRDRLKEMQQEASNYSTNRDFEELEMKCMDPSVKDFFNIAEEIVLGIRDLKKNVDEMKTCQNCLLTKVSKTEQDQQYSKLHSYVTENKALGRKLQKFICEEKEKMAKLELEAKTPSEIFLLKMRKIQISSQSERFLEVWAEFSALQVKFRDNTRTALSRNIDTNNNDEIHESEVNKEKDSTQKRLSSVEIRNAEILELEANIDEIYSMFTDFKNLVQLQIGVVNRVEDHINSAVNDVENATAVLGRAKHYQKDGNKKKIILTAVLFVLVLIVLSVILFYHNKQQW